MRSILNKVCYFQLTTAPLNGVVFASYRFLLKLQLSDVTQEPTLAQVTLAGIGCGILASYVVLYGAVRLPFSNLH